MNTFLKFGEWLSVTGGMNNRTLIVMGLLHGHALNKALWNTRLFDVWMDFLTEF